MIPSAVVFDVGNVLVEWNRDRLYVELIPEAQKRADFFNEVLTMQVNLALDAGVPFGALLGELADMHPRWRSEILAFNSRWGDTLGPEDDAMVTLVGDLKSAGVPVYALTNFAAEKWPVALERHPWLDGLDGAVISGHERVTKPDPKIYDVLVERYELDCASTWFTDDAVINVEGARAAGWQAELFVDAATTRHILSSLGVL